MNIKKINWYQQAADVKPFYISYPLHSCFNYKINNRQTPLQYEIVVYLKDNFMYAYLSKRGLKKCAQYYYQRQLKDKKFIPKLYSNWQTKYIKPYLKIVSKILEANLSKYTNEELLKLFKEFNKIYLQVWTNSIFLDNFDYYGEIILQKKLNKESKNINEKDLETILTPPEPSFIQQEEMDLSTTKNLDQHQQKYYWMHNDYATIKPLTKEYFSKRLKSLDKKEIQKLKNTFNNLKQQKKKVYQKYKLSSELITTIELLALLSNFRDARKSYQQMSAESLKKIAQQFSIRTGLPLKTIENFFYWEIENIFNKPKQSLLTEAENRYLGAFYIFNKDVFKYKAYSGKRGNKMQQSVQDSINKKNKLQGGTAYPGIVRGKVKIIKGRKDFKKLEPGDILVAPNTRPEFVPLMKIAGAIVSAEGGVTSHAAIVSRELKKPCIVGVQSALSSLKDGDLVEVDATKGIITKL